MTNGHIKQPLLLVSWLRHRSSTFCVAQCHSSTLISCFTIPNVLQIASSEGDNVFVSRGSPMVGASIDADGAGNTVTVEGDAVETEKFVSGV